MGKSVYSRFGSSALAGTDQSAVKYIVSRGDTIQSIAARFFGIYDSELWRQLAEENGITDLDAITAGTALTMPTPKPVEE